MSGRTGAAALLLVTITAAAAHAQDPERPRALRPLAAEVVPGVFWSGGVERVMRLRDELKLTEAQLNQLEEIRKQQVQRAQDMMDLRSRMAAGQVGDEAARAQMEERNAEFRKNAEEMRSRIDGILTQEQRNLLTERYSVYRVRTPLGRELRVRERVAPGELRVRERLAPGEVGPILRLREQALRRRLDRLDSLPRYYWFGTPRGDRLAPRKYQRRGVL